MGSIGYRKDIDGLRAIAVLAVVFYHAFPKLVEGGFTGVDIFFVISGFLISKIILMELSSRQFSLVAFYRRRVQRIFPALLLVLSSALIFGWFFLLSSEYKSLAEHAIASGVFLSNILLWSEAGYFDSSADFKPLLHFWSLGIEEQFYLLWPLFLVVAFKLKHLGKALCLVVIVSFFWNISLLESEPTGAFYFPGSRFWELAVGGLLAYGEKNLSLSYKRQSYLKDLLGLGGFGALLVCFYFYNSELQYPGFFALIPVVATLFIILAGPQSIINKTILSSPPMVFLGLISYPLYLWHWPIFSFGHILTGKSMSKITLSTLLILSFVLAIVTYKLVELPLKTLQRNKNGKLLWFYVSSLATVLVFSCMIFLSDGLPFRNKDLELIADSKVLYTEGRIGWKSDQCREKVFLIETCSLQNPDKPATVAIIGDSHASHFFVGLSSYYKEKGENLLLLAKSGTPPLLNVDSLRSPPQSLNDVFDFVLRNSTIHTVILSAFWSNYYEDLGTRIGDSLYKNRISLQGIGQERRQSDVLRISLNNTLKVLVASGKKVVFFYDVPAVPFYLSRCQKRPFVNELSENSCSFNIQDSAEGASGYRSVVNDVLSEFRSVSTFDPTKIICAGSCRILREDKFIYGDEHHLSIHGSMLMAEGMKREGKF